MAQGPSQRHSQQATLPGSGTPWQATPQRLVRAEIQGLTWSKLARGCMLGVMRSEGPRLCFMGFRDKDLDALKEISNTAIKVRQSPKIAYSAFTCRLCWHWRASMAHALPWTGCLAVPAKAVHQLCIGTCAAAGWSG